MVRASAVTVVRTSGDGTDSRHPRRQPSAFEMTSDLIAHDLGLLAPWRKRSLPWAVASLSMTDIGVLSAVREIADMGARL